MATGRHRIDPGSEGDHVVPPGAAPPVRLPGKPSRATAAEIEAAFASWTGERRVLVHALTLSHLPLLFVFGMALLRRAHSTHREEFAALAVIVSVLVLVQALITMRLAMRDPARRLTLPPDASILSLGTGASATMRGEYFVTEGGWFTRRSVFHPYLVAAALPVLIVSYMGLLPPAAIPVSLLLLVEIHLTRGPRALAFDSMRHVARRGNRVTVLHSGNAFPFPLVLVVRPAQWEKMVASLPGSVQVEDLPDPDAKRSDRTLQVQSGPAPRTAIDARKLKELDATLESLKKDLERR